MSKTKVRIERVAYIGWRGIEGCEVLDLDKGAMTGLTGDSGAGKSTLIICLDHALLPDREALDIQPISEVKDAKKEGLDDLAGRIDERFGFACVALDITTRKDTRLVAGIHVELNNGRTELTRWLIRDPGDLPLRSILGYEVDEEEVFPQFSEFRRACAVRGLDVTHCRRIGEYCQALYEAGILPSGMTNSRERKLYGNVIETTFRGGITHQVVSRLKDYLLPAASQVPDIVSGLQGCTDELVRTRRAIADADRELSVLKSTYGVGKEIVVQALRWMLETEYRFNDELRAEEKKSADLKATLESLAKDIPLIEKEILQTEETKKTMLAAATTQLSAAVERYTKLQATLSELDHSVKEALQNKKKYDSGKRLWKKIADINEQKGVEWIEQWLLENRKKADRRVFELDNEREALLKEADRLRRGKASELAENLADQTGGYTLDREFDEASTQEALAAELSLFGLTDGVIGMDLENLIHLPPSEHLPDTFWFGTKAPRITDVREVGDWYVSFAAGGCVATKKNRIPVFGSKARAQRLEEIGAKIKELDEQRLEAKNEAERCEEIKSNLDKNQESIRFYLEQRNSAELIEKAFADAQAAVNARIKEISAAESEKQRIESSIQNTGKPYENRILQFSADLKEKQRKEKEGKDDLEILSGLTRKKREALTEIGYEKDEALTLLGKNANWLFETAERLDEFNEAKVPVEQTKRIKDLETALLDDDASPERIALFQEADPGKRLTTIKLWPMLMEIVRERVSIDCAELDGEDLIREMQSQRLKLDGELVQHEAEVRIQARHIFQAINSDVVSKQRKIGRLSRLGESIHFGNVDGVRIAVKPRSNMIDILEGFEGHLFAERKPVDIALKDWFDAASAREEGIHLNGEQLLDYRNYVDLSIEVKRKGLSWEAATSLSGGEAIGSGLAVALILCRAMVDKGEISPEEISPMFCVDEVNRLDGKGQKMIVDFAQRENFQVIVTAPTLKPTYNCILYALTRVFDPNPRLIIRGLRVNAENQKE
jgi:chromosome condensin MukBEF ATPase and DNA-binding subunit MukB